MSKTVADKKSFNFTAGLNTEAGPLSYPPNTWQDGDNVVPQIDGSLHKRLAVNYESGYALSSQTNTSIDEQNGAFVCDEWNSVGGNGAVNFVVVQRNDTLYFYTNTADAISAAQKSFTIDLNSYRVSGNPNPVGFSPVQCVSANGKLLVVSGDTEAILVSYDEDADIISHAAVTLQIRDLYGVSDDLDVDEKPTTLSSAHKYNLLNQGWSDDKIETYHTDQSAYPANSQSWTSGKDSSDNFSSALLDKQDFGTTPAPRGRFVLSLFARDRSTPSGVAGLGSELETYRPSTCAFYAGRAWYAGIRSSSIGTWVLFSQVADTDDKYGKCYQDADPTSEVVSDLVDSDGGVIPIQDAGSIVRLMPTHNSLLVFADNGVWQISGGGSDSAFSASSYEVRKICNVGCVSARAVVEAESQIFFWASDGIWIIGANEVGGLTASNLTNVTIQSLYTEDIPITARAYASGRYYQEAKTVYWLFNSDTDQDGVLQRFKKNRMLCFDLRLKAFFTHTVSSLASSSPYVVDLVITKNRRTSSQTYGVVDSSDNTVVVSSSTVVASLTASVLRNSEVRLLTLVPTTGSVFKATFSRFEDGLTVAAKFKDWYSADSAGVGYDAFVLPGYDIAGDMGGDKELQGLYCLVFMNRTETGVDSSGNAINPSSCTMQARWDWTDNAVAGKWNTAQEVYRHRRIFQPTVPSATYTDGYPVVVSKSKIRGRGRALQLKFTANQEKDMQIVGWAITFLGNSNV